MTWYTVAYFGLALMIAALVLAFREHAWISTAKIADGEVIEMVAVRSKKGKSIYKPRVRYQAKDGSMRVFTRSYASSPPEFSVGEAVAVAYDPETSEARILTFGQRFGMSTVLASFGLAILLMSVGFIVGRTYVPAIYQEAADCAIRPKAKIL